MAYLSTSRPQFTEHDVPRIVTSSMVKYSVWLSCPEDVTVQAWETRALTFTLGRSLVSRLNEQSQVGSCVPPSCGMTVSCRWTLDTPGELSLDLWNPSPTAQCIPKDTLVAFIV